MEAIQMSKNKEMYKIVVVSRNIQQTLENVVMQIEATWMELEGITLSRISLMVTQKWVDSHRNFYGKDSIVTQNINTRNFILLKDYYLNYNNVKKFKYNVLHK